MKGNAREPAWFLACSHPTIKEGAISTEERAVLATGSGPIIPPIPGRRDLEALWASHDATSMKSAAKRLLA